MPDLPSQIGTLSPKQQELLRLLLEKKKQEKAAAKTQSIPRRPPSEPIPLSFAQEPLWFLDQLAPGNLAYNIPAAVRLSGQLDAAVLEQSLNIIGQRHESLRTIFTAVDGRPSQVVVPELPITIAHVDLRDHPAHVREELVQRQATDEFQRAFDLTRGPLWRVILFHMAEAEYVVLLVLHHIVSDVWSIRVLIRELAVIYAALSKDQPIPLEELPIQFPDFVVWQRQWLQGSVLEQQLNYWREHLRGAPTALELPADRPRPAVQSFWGARYFLTIRKPIAEGLKELSQRENVSLFMTLLAAFNTLLYRYTAQDDIVVGMPVANRNRLDLEGVMGYLINTLVLRTSLSDNPTFRKLLHRVRDVALGALAHQDMPFERLVTDLRPERDRSRNALYQVEFVLQNSPPAVLETSGLTLRPMPIETGTSQVDLTLDLTESPEGLTGWFAYDTDLFDASTIIRMANHYAVLLEMAVAGPDQRISNIPLMTAAEQRQVVVEWNATSVATPHDQCFHHLFEAQVARTPDAIAVEYEEQQISYAELDRRAGQLAVYLRSLGVQPERLAGLYLERSLELMIGLLAILKAGGAYVPLDPAHPLERLAGLLSDTHLTLLLTQAHLAERIEALAPASQSWLPPLVCLDRDWQQIGQTPQQPLCGPSPHNLLYVIYTSGSTGKPKGVAVEHRQLANYLHGILERFAFPTGASFATVSTFAADLGNTMIYAALSTGGRLHILSEERAADPSALAHYFCRRRIDCLKIVPSHLAALLASSQPEQVLPRLRLILGGEAASWELIKKVRALAPSCRIFNHYGPTETTVGVISTAVEGGRAGQTWASVPLGRPLANSQIYLLDPQMQPVPVGVPGELYIGGAGLARGYLGRPDLTAEHFVPNPFADQRLEIRDWRLSQTPIANLQSLISSGTRLYKTGDRCRYLPEGTIEYLGRVDDQVKLRGYRIEPGEIAVVLRQHGAVAEAVVVVREESGEKRLVAYLTLEDGRSRMEDRHPEASDRLSAIPAAGRGLKVEDGSMAADHEPSAILHPPSSIQGELRSFLQSRLPAYMVPSAFVVLDALPLTPNGKLDRKALPAPDKSRRDVEDDFVKPRTVVEEQLAQIWADVINLEQIGVYDNFFDLGGHSLLATQIVSRVRKAFKVDLSVRAIFEAPTIARLAERVVTAPIVEASDQAPPIRPTQSDGTAPLSFAQERLWFLDQLAPGHAVFNISGSVRLNGRLDVRLVERSIEEIIRRHEILRATFTADDGQPIQIIHPLEPFALIVVDLSGFPDRERKAIAERMAREDARRSFDLETGPLLRGHLFRLGPEDHVLAMTIHHIVYDMWSREIFVRELTAVYTALVTRRPIPLARLALQYADFAHWQRTWFQGEWLERQLDYWRQQFADIPPVLELPTDRPRTGVLTFQGHRQYLNFPQPLTDAIVRLSQREASSVPIVVLTAFKILLYRYTGQADIVVGSLAANRHRVEIEPLIGFFVNTLAMRTNLIGNPSFLECMYRVRDTALGAYANQDLPFESLITNILPRRNLNLHPLFRVIFNFLPNYSTPTIDLPDLTLSVEPLDNGAAEFDLVLHIVNTEGRLQAAFDYSTDLFEDATITRMISHYQTLLEAIIADPDRRILGLPLLSAAERKQMLVQWNTTRPVGSLELRVPQSFEAQVLRAPHAIAVACDDERLTYAELNRLANRLAHALVAQGAGPDTLVALLADRGLDFMIAVLAIFKAGGAYLPLDPEHPAERIYHVVHQSKSRLLLTTERFEPVLDSVLAAMPAGARPAVFRIETLLQQPAPEENLSYRCDLHHLAYVMFTSGSTGLPKGVMVEHGGMYNHIAAKIEDVQMTGSDIVAQNGPQCFDIFVWQCLAALLLGGRVHVFTDVIALDPARLLDQIEQQGITILQLVPSMLRALIQEVDARGEQRPALAALRWVVPTGDALPTELCRQWLQRYPGIPLLNTYGSTECSDDQCHYVISQSPPPEYVPPIMSIGGPIRRMQAYILDQMLTPVPVGVIGELYIGGTGVGRGYLDDPYRTAGVFIPDPFGNIPGARLYRTRDMVRYLPDGAIEFIGRSDHLVKIHGRRIEPGEIEAVLGQHPDVQDIVVVAREDTPGAKRLVAYIVPVAGQPAPGSNGYNGHTPSPAIADLRDFARRKLPDHMVPSAFVVLDAIPLSSNGKIDRKALPAPDLTASAKERPYVAPQTPTESALAQILVEVLKLERVGIHDDFFELGGHSLLAIQAMSRIQRDFTIRLPLRAFFERPTIAELGKSIDLARWAIQGQLRAAVVAGDDEEGEI